MCLGWFLRFRFRPRHNTTEVRQKTPRLATRRSRAARDAKPFRAGRAPRPRWRLRRRRRRRRPRRAATRTPRRRTAREAPWRTRRFASWRVTRSSTLETRTRTRRGSRTPYSACRRARPPSTKGPLSRFRVSYLGPYLGGLPIVSLPATRYPSKTSPPRPPPLCRTRAWRAPHPREASRRRRVRRRRVSNTRARATAPSRRPR